MRLTLNWRYLVKLSVACLLAGLTVHLVHGWQVRKQVGAYLRQADAAQAEGDFAREAEYLRRYLNARPSDLDARERLGRLMARTAKTGKARVEAYLVLDDVLRRDPSRDDLRRYVVEFASDPRVGLFAEARGHLGELLGKRPGDGDLEGLYARCLAAEGKYVEAADWYDKSIGHRPDRVESYADRATLLRLKLNRPDAADKVISDLLEKNPNDFRTHLTVAAYWQQFGRPEQAAAAVARAVAEAQELAPDEPVAGGVARAVAEARKLAPGELEVILLAADVELARGRAAARDRKQPEADAAFAEARHLLTGAVEHPEHRKAPAVYLAMARLEANRGDLPAAVGLLRKGLGESDRAPDSAELALALLDYQIRAGEAVGAGEILDRLRAAGLPAALMDYHQARVLALTDGWLAAAGLLERVRREVLDDPAFTRQVELLLGKCYEQLGEQDRRLDAYRRALPVDPTDPLWVPALLGMAEAQAALGQVGAALETYRKLADVAPAAWAQVARLEMIRALRSPTAGRNWGPAADALARARRAAGDADRVPTEVGLLEADLDYFRGNPAAARGRLERLRGERPKELAVWLALAVQDVRENDPTRAAATLAAAEQDLGDSPELRLARARLWAETKAADLAGKLAGLATGAEKFTRPQQRHLLRGLAGVASGVGAGDLAGRLLEQLAGVYPDDLGVHLTRFDRALRAGDEGAIERVLGDVRRVNGEAGPSARLCRAILLIWRAQQKDDRSGLGEALALLEGLERERAGWSRVALGQALVHDLTGNPDAALAKYRQAVDQGESNPDALRRLMALLAARGRFAEADEVFRRLPGESVSDPEVQRLAAEVSLRTDNPKQALELAARAVPEDSANPQDHLWLGQVAWAAGDRVTAEARFRKAIALRPDAPDAWLILVRFLSADRKAEAAAALDEAKGKVAPAERALVVALGSAQLGKAEEAATAFRQARAERPDDLRTAQAEAEFLFQTGRLGEAREAFERIIGLKAASADDREFARRMLAICLAGNPDYATSRRALEVLGLLDGGALRPPADNEPPTQRRTRAAVLALQRDRASKLQAVTLLAGLGDAATPADQFLLAQLYRAVGDRARSRVVMADLLRKSDKVPLYVAFYADWLLRDGDLREAEVWVKRLEALQPDALATGELRARLSAARKDLKSARAALVGRAEAPGAPVGRIARVCEEVGLFEDAERLFRQFAEQNRAAEPRAVLAVAAFYGRCGRTAEALRVCDEARPNLPAPAWGEAAVAALYAAPTPGAADAARVAGWLEEAARAPGPHRAALVQLLASVRNLQGDYPAAAALYREAIAADPRDALAMNNLAYLLSAREGKHDDALRLLEQAKTVIGPIPDLLDTEALVLLNKGEAGAARKLLEAVVAEAPSGPAYFHLARAELAAKRDLEARVAWRRAAELGLRPTDLHPLERSEYEELANRLK